MTSFDPVLVHFLVKELLSCFRVFGHARSIMFCTFVAITSTSFERLASFVEFAFMALYSFTVTSLVIVLAFLPKFSKRDILLLIWVFVVVS